MFLKKIVLIALSVNILLQAMDTPETAPLHLIVTSTDKSEHKDSFLFKKIWSEDIVDVSYKNAYEGETRIIELEPLIFDDTLELNLKKNTLACAYIVQSPIGALEQNNPINFFGKCIQRIGKNMKQGAKLEVELHPSIQILVQNMETVQSPFDEQHMKNNPFTAVIDSRLLSVSIQIACDKPLSNAIAFPEMFLACAQRLSQTIKNMISIYSEKKIGTKDQLKKRMLQELWLWTKLENNNYLALLSHGPTANFEDFSNAIKNFYFIETPISLDIEMHLRKEHNSLSYDSSTLLNESLLSFMLCDAAIIHSKKYIEAFMHNSGFKDPWLSRTTSKRNGRTNVWILEGTKA